MIRDMQSIIYGISDVTLILRTYYSICFVHTQIYERCICIYIYIYIYIWSSSYSRCTSTVRMQYTQCTCIQNGECGVYEIPLLWPTVWATSYTWHI